MTDLGKVYHVASHIQMSALVMTLAWAAAERLEHVFIQALSLAAWSTLLGVYLAMVSGVVTPTLPPDTGPAPAAPPTEPGDPPHPAAVIADTGPAPMSGLIEAP